MTLRERIKALLAEAEAEAKEGYYSDGPGPATFARRLRAALEGDSTAAPGEGGACSHCGQPWTAEAVDVNWTSGAHDIGVASCPACGYPALVNLDPPARAALASHGAGGDDEGGRR